MKRFSILRALLLSLVLIGLATTGKAQVGNDNPTGPAGQFNGNVTTAGNYDPYTGNATRSITDLVVAGAVGQYGLSYTRTWNTRTPGWAGNYGYKVDDIYDLPAGQAIPYAVTFPDGRTEAFAPGGTPGIYQAAAGTRERFQPLINNLCYLLLPDGGKVEFSAVSSSTYDGETHQYLYTYLFTTTAIIDPYGLRISYSYSNGPLYRVTEPGGRYIQFNYSSGRLASIQASNGPSVAYTYTTTPVAGATVAYPLLTKVRYFSDATLDAHYTYVKPNVGTANGTPLLKTCQDTMYGGPMKNITYVYGAGNNADGTAVVYGQIKSENSSVTGVALSTLTVNSASLRTETRADGATRTWTYGVSVGSYLLSSFTDFRGKSTTLGYDANGFVNSVLDANGHTTSLTRHAVSGAVTKVTHPGGASMQSHYDDTTGAYLLDTTDELGHQTTYQRNADQTVKEIDYPDSGVEKFTYNGFDQVLTHTMVSNGSGTTGGTENFSYGTRGLLLTSYPPATASDGNPSAHPTVYTYEVNDHLSTIKDPRGYVTTLYHDVRGQLTFIKYPDPDQTQIAYVYNADGTLQFTNVPLGGGVSATTSYTYDDYKRIRSVTSPGHPTAETTNFSYGSGDAGGDDYTHTDANVTRTALPSGKVIKKVYDENKRVSTATAGYGTSDAATTGYTYDDVGNLLTRTEPKFYPSGARWTYHYDTRDRLDYLIDPVAADRNSLGHTADYTYDAASNKKSLREANDRVITYDTYDTMNRLTQMTAGQWPTASAVTQYTWTRAGKVDTLTDPNNHLYDYNYDTQNRLVLTTYPGGTTETKSYDIAGNPLTFKNRGGAVQTFSYDERNREKTYSWSTGNPQPRTLVYDDASRVTACNTTNTFINFSYFNDNSLKTQTTWATGDYGDGTARTLSYSYNADRNRASVALPGVLTESYDYTGRNQVWHATSGVVNATYVYDQNGNVTSRALGNSVSSTFAYDAVNRVTSMTHPFTSGSRSLSYGYDEVGNRLSENRNGSAAETIGYDNNSQMTSYSQSGVNTNLTYDASGNRTSVGGTSYGMANNLNQYTTVGGASVSYGGNGNLSAYNGWSYSYDSMNRLTGASGPGGVSAIFSYDGLNRQVQRWISGDLTVNVWDGWNLFAEYGWSNVLKTVPIHGTGSDLIGQSAAGLATTFFYPDGSGNTAFLADSAGSLKEKYLYDLAGTPTFYDGGGGLLPNGSAYKVDMLFTGQKWYPALGLYDLRNRAYLPTLGRFLQPDPIGFGGDPSNIYRYCGNNPVNRNDPNGTLSQSKPVGKPYIPLKPLDRKYNPGAFLTSFGGGDWQQVGSAYTNSELFQMAGEAYDSFLSTLQSITFEGHASDGTPINRATPVSNTIGVLGTGSYFGWRTQGNVALVSFVNALNGTAVFRDYLSTALNDLSSLGYSSATLIGYSRGGVVAINGAAAFSSFSFNFIGIDVARFGTGSLDLPPNVVSATNYYQQGPHSFSNPFRGTPLTSATIPVNNINWTDRANINHNTIVQAVADDILGGQ